MREPTLKQNLVLVPIVVVLSVALILVGMKIAPSWHEILEFIRGMGQAWRGE